MVEDIPKDRMKDLRQEAILCRIKYHNNLPDIACDPKFLTYPFESSRFVQYAATSLERNHKYELLCEADVGVVVDLIDPDVFRTDNAVSLHPDDERLLEDTDSSAANARKSRHQHSVSWLRKTEYLSTEMYNKWNKGDKIETKLGQNIKRRLNEDIVYRDRDSQINAIQNTFEAVKKPIKRHYSKPGVHAVQVLPLFPDFTLWRYPCAQVIFDDDPARKGQSATEQKEEVSQAVIRGMVDEIGDHFVAYFLPTDETKKLRRLDAENQTSFTEGAPYVYEVAREYNWNVKNKTMANYEENYFFVFRKDGVYYNELETRVRLSKRRRLQPQHGGDRSRLPSKTRLVVQHRDFTDSELQDQTDRLRMLEQDSETEGEEEEEEEEEEVEAAEEEATERHSDEADDEDDIPQRQNDETHRNSANETEEEDDETEKVALSSEDERLVQNKRRASSNTSHFRNRQSVRENQEEEEEAEEEEPRSQSDGSPAPSHQAERKSSRRPPVNKSKPPIYSEDEEDEASSALSANSASPPAARGASRISSRQAVGHQQSTALSESSDGSDNDSDESPPHALVRTSSQRKKKHNSHRYAPTPQHDSDELSSLSD